MPAHPERLLLRLRALASPEASGTATDAELIARLLAERDDNAFAALVSRHGGLVRGVCRRVLHDAAAADDAVRAVWLVFARKAAAVRPPQALAAWLHGVARQVARNALRRAYRRPETVGLPAEPPAPPSRDPLDELTARELLLILDEEVARLPGSHRLPVLLCGLEGLSLEEAGRRLGWTAGSVKGRLERGCAPGWRAAAWP